MKNPRIIISGGGTGGHIFPAVSIANALKKLLPEAEILFVGAKDRMEMQRVPQAGYKIIGLPVKGLIRPLWSPKNIGILIDFLKSKREVKKIIKEFKPDVAVGVDTVRWILRKPVYSIFIYQGRIGINGDDETHIPQFRI